jgi:hypothetical protein
MAAGKTFDWERIEQDYRAGLKSLREIGEEHGITHAAIRKRALRDGWERNLSAKIHAKADALVSKALVSAQVSKTAILTESMLVDGIAQMQAGVRLRQRGTITKAQAITEKLLAELEQITDNRDLFEMVGETLYAPDKSGRDRLNDLYVKVIELPGRIKGAKELADTLATLIRLEREAYGISGTPDDAPAVPPAGTDDPADAYRWFASLKPGSFKVDGVPQVASIENKR